MQIILFMMICWCWLMFGSSVGGCLGLVGGIGLMVWGNGFGSVFSVVGGGGSGWCR